MVSPNPFLVEDAPSFGPDFTNTPDSPDESPEPVSTKKTTRAAGKPLKDSGGILGNLGKNSPARPSTRALTEADRDKLSRLYVKVGKGIRYVHPRLGNAMVENADDAADSWIALAAVNVKVRAKILGILEGGEIMGVAIAHAPIFLALLPENFIANILFRANGAFETLFRHHEQESDEEESSSWQQAFFAAQNQAQGG